MDCHRSKSSLDLKKEDFINEDSPPSTVSMEDDTESAGCCACLKAFMRLFRRKTRRLPSSHQASPSGIMESLHEAPCLEEAEEEDMSSQAGPSGIVDSLNEAPCLEEALKEDTPVMDDRRIDVKKPLRHSNKLVILIVMKKVEIIKKREIPQLVSSPTPSLPRSNKLVIRIVMRKVEYINKAKPTLAIEDSVKTVNDWKEKAGCSEKEDSVTKGTDAAVTDSASSCMVTVKPSIRTKKARKTTGYWTMEDDELDDVAKEIIANIGKRPPLPRLHPPANLSLPSFTTICFPAVPEHCRNTPQRPALTQHCTQEDPVIPVIEDSGHPLQNSFYSKAPAPGPARVAWVRQKAAAWERKQVLKKKTRVGGKATPRHSTLKNMNNTTEKEVKDAGEKEDSVTKGTDAAVTDSASSCMVTGKPSTRTKKARKKSPGYWTMEDDELDDVAKEIIANIGKRPPLPRLHPPANLSLPAFSAIPEHCRNTPQYPALAQHCKQEDPVIPVEDSAHPVPDSIYSNAPAPGPARVAWVRQKTAAWERKQVLQKKTRVGNKARKTTGYWTQEDDELDNVAKEVIANIGKHPALPRLHPPANLSLPPFSTICFPGVPQHCRNIPQYSAVTQDCTQQIPATLYHSTQHFPAVSIDSSVADFTLHCERILQTLRDCDDME